MQSFELADNWTMRAIAGPVPAEIAGRDFPTSVPATSHTVLLGAGAIPDPLVDLNEEALSWMRRTDWRFERTLGNAPAQPDERVDLVLEGLDTIAEVSLGDRVLAQTANQHRTYRVDVRDHLGEGAQTLRIDFGAAIIHAELEAERLGSLPNPYNQPFNMVRKMASSFGWDWGPDLQTAGIWRPVRLERWRTARLAAVRPIVTVGADGRGRVEIIVDVERSGLESSPGSLSVRAEIAGTVREVSLNEGSSDARIVLDVPSPQIWWPVGYGDQPLYALRVTLYGDDNALLGEWSRRVGFRDFQLDTTDDEYGTRFTFRVNGEPIFVKGANWIPDDQLMVRITRERLARRIDQALGANLNLLRVWGGGIYESEDFYELCDENGILVWQDFLLACAAYPEESPVWEEIEAEAREHVARLTPHPSLVLWNGGNENLWGHESWGWKDVLEGRTWGARYALELFAEIVAELDPTRAYNTNSPSSPRRLPEDVHPNDPNHGTHHEWEVWNRVDFSHYRDEVPRFCSEFGFQAPPTWATLERGVRPPAGGALTKDDPTFLLHQKAEDGNGKLDRGLAPHLGVPSEFADWHWATQLNQARAVEYALTHYRSWWPRTAGAIVWQLNDCWPVTSWAAVDGDGRPKPLWFAMGHAFAERIVTVQHRDDALSVHLVNDSSQAWLGSVRLSRESLDGTVLASAVQPMSVEPRSVAQLLPPRSVAVPGDATREVLVVHFGGARAVHAWAEDTELELDPSALTASVARSIDGFRVTISADSLVRDIALLVDRLDPDATVNDALVTLTAGESVTLHIKSDLDLDIDAMTSSPVLRSANDLRRVAPALAVAAQGAVG